MKLARVQHHRCDGYDGSTYCVVPDDMTEELLDSVVDKAQEQYLAAVDAFYAAGPKRPPYPETDISKLPGTVTVEELRQQKERYEHDLATWNQLRSEACASFGYFLERHGVLPVRRMTIDLVVTAYWGHRHDQTLNYNEGDLDVAPLKPDSQGDPFLDLV